MQRATVASLALLMSFGPVSVNAAGLTEIYRQSSGNSPGLDIAQARVDEADAAHTNAIFGMLPRINYTHDREHVAQELIKTENPTFNVGKADFENSINTVSLVQPILNGPLFLAIGEAKYAMHGEQSRYHATEQDVAFNTIETYLMTLASHDAYRLALAEYQAVQKQADQFAVRRRSGLTGSQEYDEVKAKLSSAQTQVIQTAAQVEQQFAQLEELTGRPVNDLQPLAESFPMTMPEQMDHQTWLDKALAHNPDYQALMHDTKAAKQQYDVQLTTNLPTVEVRASSTHRDIGGALFGSASESQEDIWVLRLNMPIFNSTGGGYKQREAVEAWNQSKHKMVERQRQLQRQIRVGLVQVADSVNRAPRLNELVDSRERILASSEKKYDAGLITVDDVLDDISDVYRARRDLLSSHYSYLLGKVLLQRLSGELGKPQVEQIDQLLDRKAVAIGRPELDWNNLTLSSLN